MCDILLYNCYFNIPDVSYSTLANIISDRYASCELCPDFKFLFNLFTWFPSAFMVFD